MGNRKITATWENGTTLTGHYVHRDSGGSNIVFGPDNQWAIIYEVPAGYSDDVAPGLLPAFADATIEWHEPRGFGATMDARLIDRDGFHTWVRITEPQNPGVWQNTLGEQAMWDQFSQDGLRIHCDGTMDSR